MMKFIAGFQWFSEISSVLSKVAGREDEKDWMTEEEGRRRRRLRRRIYANIYCSASFTNRPKATKKHWKL
jgi:hypothetical protein